VLWLVVQGSSSSFKAALGTTEDGGGSQELAYDGSEPWERRKTSSSLTHFLVKSGRRSWPLTDAFLALWPPGWRLEAEGSRLEASGWSLEARLEPGC